MPILGTLSSLSAKSYGFLSAPPTYSIEASSTSVNEGSSVTFTITTQNVVDGTTLYWTTNTVSGTINASDFSDSTTSGSSAISGGTASVIRTLANDLTTEGTEIFQLQLRTGSTSGPIVATSGLVTVNDTSITIIDFVISPSIGGVTNWSLGTNGALIMDGGTETTYTLVAQRNISRTVKMWGQGRSGGTGGYSTGTTTFSNGSTYTVKLNYGGGSAGTGYGSRTSSAQSGGGLAGMFIGTGISQGPAMMIAGGAGGGGDGTSGGGGGGSSGSSGQTSPNSEIGSTGGGGGSSGSGGSAGGPSDTDVYYRLSSSQNVTFTVTESSGLFNGLEIVGIAYFPENYGVQTIFVNAGSYRVIVRDSTTRVRVSPSDNRVAQGDDGGSSWDDVVVTVSTGEFTTNVPATAGSALQGGTGGNGVITQYTNAAGGGGGGGGYYGGGGGGGGNDFGNTTRDSSGGGGGSGYINGSYVSGGSTGSYQDAPNRGSAGQTNGPSRVVVE